MEHFFACNGAIGGMCITENSIARFDGSWKISRASMDKYQSSTPRQGNRSHPIMSHDLRQQDYPPQSLEIPSRRRRQRYKVQAWLAHRVVEVDHPRG